MYRCISVHLCARSTRQSAQTILGECQGRAAGHFAQCRNRGHALTVSDFYLRSRSGCLHPLRHMTSARERYGRLQAQPNCICGLMVCSAAHCPASQYETWSSASRQSPLDLAPYQSSDWDDTDTILTRIGFGEGKSLLDVGAGDGRVLLQAIQHGANIAVGYELDPNVFALGKEHIARGLAFMAAHAHQRDKGLGGVQTQGKCELFEGDALGSDVDFTAYDTVFAFLVPKGLKRLHDHIVHTHSPNDKGERIQLVTRGWPLPGDVAEEQWLSERFTLKGGSPVNVYHVPIR